MCTILKVFIEFVTILLLFYVFWFFGPEACGILAPRPGIEPAPPALEGRVLTTGPPGKSPKKAPLPTESAFFTEIFMETFSISNFCLPLLGHPCLQGKQEMYIFSWPIDAKKNTPKTILTEEKGGRMDFGWGQRQPLPHLTASPLSLSTTTFPRSCKHCPSRALQHRSCLLTTALPSPHST